MPFESGSTIRVPALANTTTIVYGRSAPASDAPLRVRCQLDGYETVWHEGTDKMRLRIRFQDDTDFELGIQEFSVTGESAGWTGSFLNSPCVHRKETVTVPTNAASFWVVMSSAGPFGTVGVYGIKNLQFTRAEPGAEPRRLITNLDPRTAEALGPRRRLVEGWTRSGLSLANAQVVRVGPERELALVLVDDSLESHTDWITPKAQAFRVQPGERLVFEWDEFYSIGIADFGSVSYEKLPAGLYRFRMVGLSFRGVPTGAEASVAVEVPVAFWKTSWFWIGNLLGLGGLVAGVWRLAEWRRMKRQLQAVEAERAVERERFRIAQDIHDDLGARVTEISLLSSSAQEQKNLSEEARANFGRVSRMSQNLVGALYETVWAVSPENDHLDSLATYVCQSANQMCSQAGLKCRLDIPDLPHDIPLTSSTRHNLVMTIKEAIHNTVKHAQATEIQIRIQFDGRRLTIDINDDGKGFDRSVKLRGNGLSNMARRVESVGGRYSQRSEPGAGTQIHLELPLESHGRSSRGRST